MSQPDPKGFSSSYLDHIVVDERAPAWILGKWPGPTLARLRELRKEFGALRAAHEALGVAVEQFGHALGLAVDLEEAAEEEATKDTDAA